MFLSKYKRVEIVCGRLIGKLLILIVRMLATSDHDPNGSLLYFTSPIEMTLLPFLLHSSTFLEVGVDVLFK